MLPDNGFAALVQRGPMVPLDNIDLAVLHGEHQAAGSTLAVWAEYPEE
jgi:hypothetical protein